MRFGVKVGLNVKVKVKVEVKVNATTLPYGTIDPLPEQHLPPATQNIRVWKPLDASGGLGAGVMLGIVHNDLIDSIEK